MSETETRRIKWYRIPVDRDELKALNQRSNIKGLLQGGGHLLLLAVTGTAAVLSAQHLPWWSTALILFAHGTFWAFLLNGFHELTHGTVFRSPWLNKLFLNIFSFLSWNNPVYFWASHSEHHKFTLHHPDDMEIILPMKITLPGFLEAAFINPRGFFYVVRAHVRHLFGIMASEWDRMLFPKDQPEKTKRLRRWSAITLFGHLTITVISIAMGWYMIPVVVTLAPFYGGWLLFLLNNTQHVGLTDNVPDFRLCCRTIHLDPFLRFLYWNMNYHVEHHMYAGVPCYNLKKLSRAIAHEMPTCTTGVVNTWVEIAGILKKQKKDPTYQYAPAIPEPAGS